MGMGEGGTSGMRCGAAQSLQSRPGIEDQRVEAKIRSADGLLSISFDDQLYQVRWSSRVELSRTDAG
jgi:hypothetical protein